MQYAIHERLKIRGLEYLCDFYPAYNISPVVTAKKDGEGLNISTK